MAFAFSIFLLWGCGNVVCKLGVNSRRFRIGERKKLPSPWQDKIHSFRPEDVLIIYTFGPVTTWWNAAELEKLRDPDKWLFQLHEDFWPLLGINIKNLKKWIQACITLSSSLFFQMQETEPNAVSSKIIHTSSFTMWPPPGSLPVASELNIPFSAVQASVSNFHNVHHFWLIG